MSAAQRMPVLAGTLGIGAVVAAISTIPAVRNVFSRYVSFSAPGGIWRILAILFALINLKNLPFLWHVSSSRAVSNTTNLFFQMLDVSSEDVRFT